MQDRPTAIELLHAAREFCERELGPALEGRMRFQVRVLQNILGILEREWESEEDALHREFSRLSEILDAAPERPPTLRELAVQVKEMNRTLSARIRAGELDERADDVRRILYEIVREKLAISNPNYASSATSTGASARSTR
jgi:hypothetical protein